MNNCCFLFMIQKVYICFLDLRLKFRHLNKQTLHEKCPNKESFEHFSRNLGIAVENV